MTFEFTQTGTKTARARYVPDKPKAPVKLSDTSKTNQAQVLHMVGVAKDTAAKHTLPLGRVNVRALLAQLFGSMPPASAAPRLPAPSPAAKPSAGHGKPLASKVSPLARETNAKVLGFVLFGSFGPNNSFFVACCFVVSAGAQSAIGPARQPRPSVARPSVGSDRAPSKRAEPSVKKMPEVHAQSLTVEEVKDVEPAHSREATLRRADDVLIEDIDDEEFDGQRVRAEERHDHAEERPAEPIPSDVKPAEPTELATTEPQPPSTEPNMAAPVPELPQSITASYVSYAAQEYVQQLNLGKAYDWHQDAAAHHENLAAKENYEAVRHIQESHRAAQEAVNMDHNAQQARSQAPSASGDGVQAEQQAQQFEHRAKQLRELADHHHDQAARRQQASQEQLAQAEQQKQLAAQVAQQLAQTAAPVISV